ncbi:Fpg/Nei family DNA glycosylase [Solicola gregarius]|uniref:Fpg/Nei family DNA glycosylase n=1 Tax=Solicola gregarius TaxID=2908642 RepID=A0AA46TLL5_9ACTN|nr:DNA-formamidopyrimidine glycosylase family protein [Solicola gregarius]UYM07552.1 Fpg/Nei family DNA glycosylase [Solicola gregarius]
MPELPEVAALVADLRPRLEGRAIVNAHLTAFSALKTFDPPLDAFRGLVVDGVDRHGKFLDIEAAGLHLVIHLSRAGWVRWKDAMPAKPPRPGGKGPLALRVVLDDDSGFDVTEAGTQKRLAVYAVRDPADVPGVARLGPDPLGPEFTREVFAQILRDAGRAQIKGVLRTQQTIAGIGNAYSDEILHVAKMSPFKPASAIEGDVVDELYAAIDSTLRDAMERSEGVAAAELKKEKKSAMRVHGRTGEACPVCGDTVAEVSFADSSLQYCPTCQTAGKKLADRRMSKLLK